MFGEDCFHLRILQVGSPGRPEDVAIKFVPSAPSQHLLPFWRFRLFSGFWNHIEAAAVEVDRVNEVLFVPKASRCVLHPLDLTKGRLAGSWGARRSS